MAAESPPRSRKARATAEAALLRIVRNCGRQPEFVVLGGLVPELLCAASPFRHAGTTDIDVQINLEIVCGAANATVLEKALRGAGFAPEAGCPWRWVANRAPDKAGIKFEMLADLDNEPASSTILFDASDSLGAANLRGTGFVARDFEVRELSARIEGVDYRADVRVAGLAGFLQGFCRLSTLARAAERQTTETPETRQNPETETRSGNPRDNRISSTANRTGGKTPNSPKCVEPRQNLANCANSLQYDIT